MSIVRVSRRRIYIPRSIPFNAERALVIPLGDSLLIVPIPDKPIEFETKKGVRELKEKAEKLAKLDALRRRAGGDRA